MKFEKISNKSISLDVKGQEVYYQHLPDNGKTYDHDVCGCDCIEYTVQMTQLFLPSRCTAFFMMFM